MGSDVFEVTVNFLKMVVIFMLIVQLVPMLVWVERRGSGFIQNRLGPNRVGPIGLTQLLADAVKFIFKEEFIPAKAQKFLYLAAPIIGLIPAALAFGAIPLSIPIDISQFQMFGEMWGPYTFKFQSYEIGVGIVFVLAVSSLASYSVLLAGYSSANKFSLLGAIRGSAQMISYELALGLALVGILLVYGTFNFQDMIAQQLGPLRFGFFGQNVVVPFLPNWGIFYQPLGFVLFFCATFAESNRLPFDLPEAEAELVAGYHTEYGGFKFNMFFIGEYGHMIVAAALVSIFYFGGYEIPLVSSEAVRSYFASHFSSPNVVNIVTALALHVVLFTKILFFLWIFIWVRWTLPRFRYDQLMDLGWKTMLPWALFNALFTAVWIYLSNSPGAK